eukprot:CAMPEP_0168549282 /NCGR_PEP_ID=MMETSP0413-20121227/5018_1 /TAXON_ID=136452 /ORGANISM="Filamoeba nolandi, Strain NC-AS-23-1" /LENGTH=432 /DNA_ID=CAMNT_0008579655 /DNA_START=158 /DNA_END=1453 /DNA_ORIENTATION=-
MIFGILVGVLFEFLHKLNLEHEFDFEPEMFYFVLLPPIIFEAGYSMKKKNFFLNMGTILLYAVAGTLVSAAVFGYGLFFFAKTGAIGSIDRNHALESLLFGSLISATDPVATLSIMGSPGTQVDPTLYSLVFGESVLNDAVAIVLFRTLSDFTGNNFTFGDFVSCVGRFILISLSSMMFAYVSYLVAELAETSGVMSLFLTGVTMKHYPWYSISKEGQTTSEHAFKIMAFAAETFVFVYLGINITASISNTDYAWDPLLLLIATFLCLLSRAFNIFGLTALANLKRKKKITGNMQIMLWFAGLRGAVAYSLSLNIDTKNRSYIVTTTLFLVLFTTLVEGGLTAPLINKLGLKSQPSASEEENEALEGLLMQGMDEDGNLLGSETDDAVEGEFVQPPRRKEPSLQETTNPKSISVVHKYWRWFDEKVMKPLFG